MSGLQRILKNHGAMTVGGVKWVWDYENDKPRRLREMTRSEVIASNKARWRGASSIERVTDELLTDSRK
mgnify:CR=1 FL=1